MGSGLSSFHPVTAACVFGVGAFTMIFGNIGYSRKGKPTSLPVKDTPTDEGFKIKMVNYTEALLESAPLTSAPPVAPIEPEPANPPIEPMRTTITDIVMNESINEGLGGQVRYKFGYSMVGTYVQLEIYLSHVSLDALRLATVWGSGDLEVIVVDSHDSDYRAIFWVNSWEHSALKDYQIDIQRQRFTVVGYIERIGAREVWLKDARLTPYPFYALQ